MRFQKNEYFFEKSRIIIKNRAFMNRAREMKKFFLILGILLTTCLVLSADLLTAYKKGEIAVVPDPRFGVKVEWDMLFKARYDKSLAFLPDGSFFRTAYQDGKIYKFNEKGEVLLEFCRKGQGPGDLQYPLGLDIIDGEYLVVNDAGNRRLSLFDLNGRFIKSIKVENYVPSVVALQDDKVGLVMVQPGSTEMTGGMGTRHRVLIKDLESGIDTDLAYFDDIVPRSAVIVKVPSFYGTVHIARAGSDKLLVAYSKSPEISIYSLSGQKLSSFPVNLEPQKIKWDHLEYAGDTTSEDQASREMFLKFITMNKGKILLPEFHQLYLALTPDSESHILLYLNNLAQKSQDIAFLVYSLDGKLLCTTKIKAGEFEPVRPASFYKNYCYATLTRKSDGSQFLARIKLSD